MIIDSTPKDVSWFSSSQINMPSVKASDPDGIVKILDACLVDGGQELNVLSLSITDNDVTLSFNAGHGFNLYQVIAVSGSDDPLINGNHKIVSITNNTATLNIPGALIDTGTVKAKMAPLGYESVFGKEDQLKRAYRSLSPKSSKRVLYIDMSYPDETGYATTSPLRRAMIDICEDMQSLGVQINSLTSLINNREVDLNGNLFWYQSRNRTQSSSVDDRELSWMVIGNGEFFYLCVDWSQYSSYGTAGGHSVFGFGEYIKLGQEQSNKLFLMASENKNDTDSLYGGGLGGYFAPSVSSGVTAFNTNSGVFKENLIALLPKTYCYSGRGSAPYPSAAGNFLFTHPLRLLDDDDSVVGFMPSYLFVEHTMEGENNKQVIDGCLIVRVYMNEKSSPDKANVAFYVGV